MFGADLNQQLQERGYVFQFDYGCYDYSWDETRVYTSSGRVFSLTDSGCSCSSFGDYWKDIHDALGEMREVTSLPELNKYDLDSSSHSFPDIDSLREKFMNLGVR